MSVWNASVCKECRYGRAREPFLVLVAMCVGMGRAVTVRVDVDRVGVVVVNGPIRVGNISVILIRRIRVIATAGI